jgi:hypothetical protein
MSRWSKKQQERSYLVYAMLVQKMTNKAQHVSTLDTCNTSI